MPSALARIQLRQGLSSDWVTANPVLASGEPGVESDTLKIKVGDGTRVWNQLPYVGDSGLAGTFVTSVNSKTGAVTLLPSDLPGLSGFIKTIVAQTLAPGANVGISELTADGKLTISSTASSAGGGGGGGTVTGISVTSLNGKSGVVGIVGVDGVTVADSSTAGQINIGVTPGGTWGGTPTIPAAPTAVTAVGLEAQAQVSWVASAGLPAAQYYTVQYSSNSGVSWQTFGDTPGAATALTVTGLTNDVPYLFRARATSGTQSSAWSAVSSPATPVSAGQPPTLIELSASSIKENNLVDDVVGELSAVSPDVTATHTFAITGGANASNFLVSGTSLLAHSVLTVAGGASRVVTIRATNSAGLSTTKTFTITVVSTATVPAVPVSLTASAGAVSSAGADISLAWTAPADNGAAITSYHIQCKLASDTDWSEGPAVGAKTSATITGLNIGAAYNVRVSAVNREGEGAFATANVTTSKAVITFTTQPADENSTDGTASFTAAAATTGVADLAYQWQKLAVDGTWADVTGKTSATLSFTSATNADDGARYRLKVTASDADTAYSDTAVLSVAIPLWRRTTSPVSYDLTLMVPSTKPNAQLRGYQVGASSDGQTAVVMWIDGDAVWSSATSDGSTFSDPKPPKSDPVDLEGNAYQCRITGSVGVGSVATIVMKETFTAGVVPLYNRYRKWTPDGVAWVSAGKLGYRQSDAFAGYVPSASESGLYGKTVACTAGFFAWSELYNVPPLRSTDGISWTVATSPIPSSLSKNIACFPAGSKLFDVRGKLSSDAGLTWTVAAAPPAIAGAGWIASAYAGGKLFLFGAGNKYAVTSNFTSWQLKTLPFTDNFRLAAASSDGTRIAIIGARQQAAVCRDIAAETWVIEQMPVSGQSLDAIAATSTHIIAFGSGECCVRSMAVDATPPPPPANTSYNCVNGVCTAITGLTGTYSTMAACQAACVAPPPPANPTALFKANAAQWRHETVNRPACAAAKIAAPQLSYNACRVSWPAGSISYSRYTVEWATPAVASLTPAVVAQGPDVGFTAACAYIGNALQPYSYRAVSANEIDFYNFDKLLPAGASARSFHVLPDTAAGLTQLQVAGLSFSSGVQVGNATDVYISQRYASFKITFYLTTGGTHSVTVKLPTVDLAQTTTPGNPPLPPIPVPEAPAGITAAVWTQAYVAPVCWDIASVSWTAPATAPTSIKLEYLVPGHPAQTVTIAGKVTRIPATVDQWVAFPLSPATCSAGSYAGPNGLCVLTPGWSSYRRPTSTSIAIYKHSKLGACGTRVTGQSRTFRLSFGNAGGFGPATQFTVTT